MLACPAVQRRIVGVAIPLALVLLLFLVVLNAGLIVTAINDALRVTGRTIDTLITALSQFMRTWGMPPS